MSNLRAHSKQSCPVYGDAELLFRDNRTKPMSCSQSRFKDRPWTSAAPGTSLAPGTKGPGRSRNLNTGAGSTGTAVQEDQVLMPMEHFSKLNNDSSSPHPSTSPCRMPVLGEAASGALIPAAPPCPHPTHQVGDHGGMAPPPAGL